MRNTFTFIGFAVCLQLAFGQIQNETISTIKRVTVYKQGAQIEREAEISLEQGQTIIKLTGLSPYINENSIRVDGDGTYTILGVQHQVDFINQLNKSTNISNLTEKIKNLQFKVEDEEIRIKISKEKLDFLNANKNITGNDQVLNPETYKSLNSIYGNNIETIHLDILKKQRQIKQYNEEIIKLNNQLNSLHSKSDLPSGTILITIDSKTKNTSELKLNYLVDNATWSPSYDVRFVTVNKPLTITHKANIRQNTGVDWKDTKIILATSKTDISAQIPKLTPSYLQFYYPEITQALQGKLAGVQISSESGSSIHIRGANSIKPYNEPLYVVDGVPVKDISGLNANNIDKIEVLKDASATAIYGSRGNNGVVIATTKVNANSSSIPFTITSKQVTSNKYIVETAQTIASNNKTNTINFRKSELNANFEYQSTPKLSENVFLIGKINDWYKEDLMNGELNVYMENSYVGKSVINTQQFADTLEISFGIDNNISIKRERLSEFSESQFIGSNRKETVAYKISIRNNKSYPVTATIKDQIPVSTTKEIQV